MYIHGVWLQQNPTKVDLQVALKALGAAVLKYPAKSKLFLYDVCKVMCTIEKKLAPFSKTQAMPSLHNFLPLVNSALRQTCVHTILQAAHNTFAASLYIYTYAIKSFKNTIAITKNDTCSTNTSILKKIMTRFSSECKFKNTNDLFIWILLYLKLPPWTILAQQKEETPYNLISRHFAESTNSVVQPLTKESVENQLLTATGYKHFCILAALTLELTNHKSTIAINHAILQTDKLVPTFALCAKPFTLNEDSNVEFGYVLKNHFYVFADPYFAIQQWAFACDKSSAFSEVCNDEISLTPGNPFLKFVEM